MRNTRACACLNTGLELHAETREVVDIEKAAVVDFVLGDAMKRDAPELLADEPIEFAPVLVERLDPIIDRRPRFFAVIGQRNEFAFQGPRPFRDLRPPLRQVEKKVRHADPALGFWWPRICG